jgi:rubrerythrin
VNDEQVHELLYQALETELGGVKIYETAIRCAKNNDLRAEWQKYHEQTTNHVEIVLGLFGVYGLDLHLELPARMVVRHIGDSLIRAMEMALAEGNPEMAELVAAECVILAESKDHLNWELLAEVGKKSKGEQGKAVRAAVKEIEEQEDEHLYHTNGWARELWIDSLGLPSVLPPPEERKQVKTAIGAERAKKARGEMARRSRK